MPAELNLGILLGFLGEGKKRGPGTSWTGGGGEGGNTPDTSQNNLALKHLQMSRYSSCDFFSLPNCVALVKPKAVKGITFFFQCSVLAPGLSRPYN